MSRIAAAALGLLLPLAAAFAQSTQQPPPRKSANPPAVQKNETPEALLARIEEALRKSEWQTAESLLRKFLAEKPGDAVAHFHLGYALSRQDRKEEAQTEYAKAIEKDPKLAAAHQNLGALLLENNPANALAPLSMAVELEPGNFVARFLLGAALERSGNTALALEHFQFAAKERPQIFDFRLALARSLLANGRAADAEREFRAAHELQQDAPQPYLGLAESLIAQGKLPEALEPLQRYALLQPSDRESRVQLASLLFDLQQFNEAAAEMDRLAAENYSSSKLLQLRVEWLLRQRKIDEAIPVMQQIVAATPSSPEGHARLGRLYLEKRDFARAERSLLDALKLDASLLDVARDLATVYYLGEKYDAALRVLDELARREPPGAGQWFVRAVCLDKLQRKPEALQAYEKFVQLDQGRNADKDFQARQRIRILKRELERKR